MMSADIALAFEALDEAYARSRRLVLAYSGGKDSTAAAILLYQWARERGPRDLELVILHNDTMSEIPPMELWARRFMGELASRLEDLGARPRVLVAAPGPTETFYWRVFVRGYPAPTFNFRWCVYLLKTEPTRRALRRLGDYVVVVGSRDEESSTRAKSMRLRFGSCPLSAGPGSCLGAMLAADNDIPKVAPIRFWRESDVWAFLASQRDFDVSELFDLYALGGRYGCWHCTLAAYQRGLHLRPEYAYVEAVRVLYRAASDAPELRSPELRRFGGLGPLNALGRSVVLNAIAVAEELAGGRFFYGLDESRAGEYTLREVFYELPEAEADEVVARLDGTGRRVPVSELRGAALRAGRRLAEALAERAAAWLPPGPWRGDVLSAAERILGELS